MRGRQSGCSHWNPPPQRGLSGPRILPLGRDLQGTSSPDVGMAGRQPLGFPSALETPRRPPQEKALHGCLTVGLRPPPPFCRPPRRTLSAQFKTCPLHPQANGWAPNPPIHEWRIPSSNGEHGRTPGSTDRNTHSAFIPPP